MRNKSRLKAEQLNIQTNNLIMLIDHQVLLGFLPASLHWPSRRANLEPAVHAVRLSALQHGATIWSPVKDSHGG